MRLPRVRAALPLSLLAAHRVYTRTVALRRGANTIHLRDWLWGRRYRLELVAVDADHNVAKPVRMRISLR